MEEKILQELKEVKKELQDIRSTLEQKKVDQDVSLTIEHHTKLLERQIQNAKKVCSSIL